MINQLILEGYIVQKPILKQKYENETKPYVRFELLHYPEIGSPYRITCCCFHEKTMNYLMKKVNINQRVLIFGTFNLYFYKNPAGKQKQLPSLIINKRDGIKILDIPEADEDYIQKQKIGFPGETLSMEKQ